MTIRVGQWVRGISSWTVGVCLCFAEGVSEPVEEGIIGSCPHAPVLVSCCFHRFRGEVGCSKFGCFPMGDAGSSDGYAGEGGTVIRVLRGEMA